MLIYVHASQAQCSYPEQSNVADTRSPKPSGVTKNILFRDARLSYFLAHANDVLVPSESFANLRESNVLMHELIIAIPILNSDKQDCNENVGCMGNASQGTSKETECIQRGLGWFTKKSMLLNFTFTRTFLQILNNCPSI